VAQGLADLINTSAPGYVAFASSDGAKLVIRRVDGTAFTVTPSTTSTAAGTTFSVSNTGSTLSDTAITSLDPQLGAAQPGFDKRANEFPYAVTILSGNAAGVVMDIDSVNGTTVTFKTAWPAGKVPSVGDKYVYAPTNLNFRVDEADQVDV